MANIQKVIAYLAEEMTDEEWREVVSDERIQKRINKARMAKKGARELKFASSFVPPTIQEVEKYSQMVCSSKGIGNYKAVAEKYFYSRVNSEWTRNGGKMNVKNWKADFIVSLNWTAK